MEVLFLAKHKPFAQDAAELVRRNIGKAVIIFGDRNDPFPPNLISKEFDYIISYISPWIVPPQILKNTRRAAINFHPGPPEYPGIGCTNFAIYNGENEFGITVHYMKERVDSGEIIHIERFPIFDNDTVYSLTQRCYEYLHRSFVNIFPLILQNQSLPIINECWKRKPYTRNELNALCRITKDMPENEVKKRIKATTYPNMPGAYFEK